MLFGYSYLQQFIFGEVNIYPLRYKFLFSVFVFFFILVFVALGSWQIVRLNWKLNLISEIESSLTKPRVELSSSQNKNFLKIKTSGEINYEKQIYLYNLNEEGKPGFEVINPISIDTKNYLINRGWIQFDKKGKSEINNQDEKNITGILKRQNKANYFKPKNDINKNYWFTLNRDDIFVYTGKRYSEYVIYIEGDYQLPKPKKINANISNNHKKYSITWFSLAISILILYLYFRKKNY